MANQLIVLCDGTDESPQTDVAGVQDNIQLLRTLLAQGLPATIDIAKSNSQGWSIDVSTYGATRRFVYYDIGLGSPTLNQKGQETRWSWDADAVLQDVNLVAQDFEDAESAIEATGIIANIKQAYRFLVQYYTPGDQIFLFGFSRGAYTHRLLISFINHMGLIDKSKYSNSSDLDAAINQAFTLYSAEQTPNTAAVENFRNTNSVPLNNLITFYGAFDCVPGLESEPFYEDAVLAPLVQTARHAIAIDESRPPFAPQLWVASPNTDSLQCWFPGSHEDLGGGYADHALANVPLQWMICEAAKSGFYIVPANLSTPDLSPNILAPQHDSGSDDIVANVPLTWDDVFTPTYRTIALSETVVISTAAQQRYGQQVTTVHGTLSTTVGPYTPANLAAVLKPSEKVAKAAAKKANTLRITI